MADGKEKAAELLRVLEEAFSDVDWVAVRKEGGRLIELDSSHGLGVGWEKEIVKNVRVLMHVLDHTVNLPAHSVFKAWLHALVVFLSIPL
ncbi:unnamed protein product [Symbiodinium sp. CCMP2592]|nr:unnamed protein product [Symbiodinium sp. CCMP2592]